MIAASQRDLLSLVLELDVLRNNERYDLPLCDIERVTCTA